jgi:hypothetical protein
VIVRYLHRIRVAIAPLEAKAPLIIDTDAVLPSSVAFEPLKPIAWRHPQVLKGFGGIKE